MTAAACRLGSALNLSFKSPGCDTTTGKTVALRARGALSGESLPQQTGGPVVPLQTDKHLSLPNPLILEEFIAWSAKVVYKLFWV